MARVTIDDCVDKVENRFDLVLLVSRRAKQLHEGSAAKVLEDDDKDIIVALREIAAGKSNRVTIEQEEKATIEANRELNSINRNFSDRRGS